MKDGNASQYWLDIKKLITPDTEVVRSVPWVQGTDPNPVKPYAKMCIRDRAGGLACFFPLLTYLRMEGQVDLGA